MATIRPFRSIRPAEGMAEKIAALPYDVYNRKEACEVVKDNKYSFLNIDRAETAFDDSVDTYDERVYAKAKELLDKMREEGLFIQDGDDKYYIYELTMDERTQTGLVACALIDDYKDNIIKKHENTRADKEADRIHHVDTCNAQTGPIFLAYRANKTINEVIKENKKKKPVYDFVSDDGITHRVWVIDKLEDKEDIYHTFCDIKDIYIADGHHRAASAVKVGFKRREQKPNFDRTEEFNFFLSVLFPDEELMIMPYNRVVKDLNGHSNKEFLKLLGNSFDVKKNGKRQYSPDKKGNVGMFLDGEWYILTAKKAILNNDPVDGLDVSLLQNNVLYPILGIEDPKTDKRIDFVGGIRGLGELEKRCKEDMKVAFSMYPTSIKELFAVADAGLLMPPKSTWFEPKLRSGLFIHSLED